METSFCAIATQGPLASRLLDLLAFVNYDDIFLALFDPAIVKISRKGVSTLPENWDKKLGGMGTGTK